MEELSLKETLAIRLLLLIAKHIVPQQFADDINGIALQLTFYRGK